MSSIVRKWLCIGAVGLLALVIPGVRAADAAPIGSVEYIETNLGGGLFQYDYTLHNLGDPLTDAGSDLFDFALFFPDAVSLVGDDVRNAAPTDWQVIGAAGFVDSISLTPGAAPVGADIGPGGLLTGFRFVLDGQIGNAAFQMLFADPNEPFDPIIFEGVAAPMTVPEPASLLLAGVGLGLLLVVRRKRTLSAEGLR
jgi:hypothetical protein